MRRFGTSQKVLLTCVFLLSLLTFNHSFKALAQKIDADTLEIDQDIGPINRTVSIIANVRPAAVFQGGQLTIQVIGRIDRDHHLYSIRQQGEFSPIPTKIVVTDPLLIATSKMDESGTLLTYDDAFEEPLYVHKDDFWISQQYILSEKAKPGNYQITGYLIYQICNNRICSLPLKNHFREKITIKK